MACGMTDKDILLRLMLTYVRYLSPICKPPWTAVVLLFFSSSVESVKLRRVGVWVAAIGNVERNLRAGVHLGSCTVFQYRNMILPISIS